MNKVQSIQARIGAAREKGKKAMWYMVLADTVVDVLSSEETISRADLAKELRRRSESADAGEILEASHLAAADIVENGLTADD